MPILDPSLQYSLTQIQTNNLNANFFPFYLHVASENVNKNLHTIKYSIQFKNELENNIKLINQTFSCNILKENFQNSSLKYIFWYLSKQIRLDNKIYFPSTVDYFVYNGIYSLKFCVPYSDQSHTWFLTDSPIAILTFRAGIECSFEMINLEIDLMKASGFTLVLCISANIETIESVQNFLSKTVGTHFFEEIHLNLENDDKNYQLTKKDEINLQNIKSYLYIYTQFFILNDIDQITSNNFIQIFPFSQKLSKTFKYSQNCFAKSKPFPYCQTGFDQEKIRIVLCNVPLFESANDEVDIMPSNTSDLTLAYISPRSFIKMEKTRVPIILDERKNANKHVEYFINYDDIHFLKSDFYVKNTLYLIKMKSDTLNIISNITNEFNKSKEKKKFFSIKKDKIQEEMENVLKVFYDTKRLKEKDFMLHPNQIFTIYDACTSFFNVKKEDKRKGVIYQVETGEGKSYIIILIAAVLSRLMKKQKIHISSSNINLSKRDYEESYDFFKSLDVTSTILLHSNELPNENSDERIKFYNEIFFKDEIFNNTLKMNYDVCGICDETTIDQEADIIFSTFINFESLNLRMTEIYPKDTEKYFSKCFLLIDEADSILIDELANGTVLSHPVKSNGSAILTHVYLCKKEGKTPENVLNEVQEKFPNCTDLDLSDIKKMFDEIDIVNQVDFEDGKKYFIKKCFVEDDKKSKSKLTKIKNIIKDIKTIVSSFYNFEFEDDKDEEEAAEHEYQKIVPFDYDNKGVLEPNQEFGGFVQQFIAIKELIENKKTNMKIKSISMNYLYISHPIFVKKYKKVNGFTGTIGNKYCKEIFLTQYELTTKKISRNKPNRLIKLPAILCKDNKERINIIINDIILFHSKGNPVLVIFKDLKEITAIKKILELKGINNIHTYDGSNENDRFDVKSGRIGAVSLGTNFFGRGTNIQNPEKPLHVIVTYFTSNDRVMTQAYGRTARQGNNGTVRVICLKSEYIQNIQIFTKNNMENVLTIFKINNDYQNDFIDKFRRNRKWIFDGNVQNQKMWDYPKYIEEIRKTKINVNRSKAYNVEYPLCMSVKTFLEIQSQKIFSLYNCPNSKYTWILFQRYIREMILQSWSLFIEKTENDYNMLSEKIDYKKYLSSKFDDFYNLICSYIPNNVIENTPEDFKIIPTFMNIFVLVREKWERTIYNSCPRGSSDKITNWNNKYFCFGFIPFSLLDYSGAKINTFDNPDEINYVIEDPELRYITKTHGKSKLLSITRKIDDLFNRICQKISEIIGTYIGLKLFLRRTLGGCEFWICFDFEFENLDENNIIDPNCIIDKDPLLVFTLNIKSRAPIMAGLLIIALIYVIKICKNIWEWSTGAGGIAKLAVSAVKSLFKYLASNFMSQKIDLILSKVCSFLQDIIHKQVQKMKEYKEKSKFADLLINISKLVEPKDFEIDRNLLSKMFSYQFKMKKNSMMEKLLTGNLPIGSFIKIGLLLMLCIVSFFINLHSYSLSVKYNASQAAKEYNDKQNAESSIKKYDYTIQLLKIEGELIIGKSKEYIEEYDSLVFAEHNIVKATIPSYIKKICESAFSDCNLLETIKFSENSKLTIIDKNVFTHSSIVNITIPSSVKQINENAFFECKKLLYVNFAPNSNLILIGKDSFNGTSINEIKIPSEVQRIEERAFYQCNNLESIIFEDDSKLKYLGKDVFSGTSINELKFPQTVEEIEDGCFNGIERLDLIVVPSENKYYQSIENNKILVQKIDKKNNIKKANQIIYSCHDISSFKIPSNIKRIKESSFYNCQLIETIHISEHSLLAIIEKNSFCKSSIQSIFIPKNVISIGENAFSECKQLKIVKFDEDSKLENICKEAFKNTEIKNIIIPRSVIRIEEGAFSGCQNLERVQFETNSRLQNIGKCVFANTIITNIILPSSVTHIENESFADMDYLKTLTLQPNSKYFSTFDDGHYHQVLVQNIDKSNFKKKVNQIVYACPDIGYIVIPTDIKKINQNAFAYCFYLSIKSLPDSKLKLIDKNAFYASNITDLTIPKSVTQINENAFYNCNSLKQITFEKDCKLQIISKKLFNNTSLKTIKIPKNVVQIDESAFSQCSRLSSVLFEENSKLQIIGKNAFTNTNLNEILIPKNVTRIEEGAFSEILSLINIFYEEDSKLKFIGKNAFNSSELEEITIPSLVEEIEDGCFDEMEKLKAIVVAPESKFYSSIENNKILIQNYDKKRNSKKVKQIIHSCRDISNFNIPSYIRSIKESSFYNCKMLKMIRISDKSELKMIEKNSFCKTSIQSIFIPKNVISIGENAFSECKQLKTVKFDEDSKLENICKEAFKNTNIESITIPRSVIRIEEGAFSGCQNLETVQFETNSRLQYIGKCAFSETKIKEIEIPKNVSQVDEGVFLNCSNMNSINFDVKSKLKLIGKDLLEGTSIDTIQFPDVVEDISFSGLSNLKNISVSQNCQNYALINDNKIVIRKSSEIKKKFYNIVFSCKDIKNVIVPSYIRQINESAFADCNELESIEFSDNSKLNIIEQNAFLNSSINNITIPMSVTLIGQSVFSQCMLLKSIKFSDYADIETIESDAFSESSIENILIPMSTTKIGERAFKSCFNLKSVIFENNSKLRSIENETFNETLINNIVIPKNVSKIGERAFCGCSDLKSIEFEANSKLKVIDKEAFFGTKIESIIFPMNVNQINESVFSQCKSLKIIKFEENSNLNNINKNAFSETSIEEIVIPKEVVRIEENAFYKCSSLKNVIFEEKSKLKYIGKNAFSGTLIEEIKLPSEVSQIDDNAFLDCLNLKSFIIDSKSKLRFIGKNAFKNSLIDYFLISRDITQIEEGTFYNCKNLKKVEFHKNTKLRLICVDAFNNTRIKKIEIPTNVIKIEERAFYSCKKLKNVRFKKQSKLKSIGKDAFNGSSIKEINIPINVVDIGERAFFKCKKLLIIRLPRRSHLKEIHKDAFNGTKIEFIILPDNVETLEDGWNNGMKNLKIIHVSVDNDFFSMFDSRIILRKNNSIDSIFFVQRTFADTNVIIPPQIKRICNYAFSDCQMLESIEFSNDSKIEVIENNAFSKSSIKTFEIPNSVNQIGEGAFFKCKNLDFVKFNDPHELINIPINCFAESGLIFVTIPSSVKKIGDYAFSKCKKLKFIIFKNDSNLKTIGKFSFSKTKIKEIKIPFKVMSIGDGAFAYCKKLKSIKFEKNCDLQYFGRDPFYESGIKEFVVPRNVLNFSNSVFGGTKIKYFSFEERSLFGYNTKDYKFDDEHKLIIEKSFEYHKRIKF